MIAERNLQKSLIVVAWLTELITNGPDTKPYCVLQSLELIGYINNQWPDWFRKLVIAILEEATQ
jgi:hypothetical protein